MILTIGKYAILASLYAFVLMVFRGIMSQLASESRREQQTGASARRRRRKPSPERAAARTAPEPETQFAPEPEQPSPRPSEAPRAPIRSEPAAPERDEPEPAGPEPAAPASKPDALRELTEEEAAPSGIDLLGEQPEVTEEAAEEADPGHDVPEPSGEPAHLLVIDTGSEEREAGETLPLSAAVTIGRADENSLQISDRFISGRHALIRLQNGRRILMDRGSKNGTFVNGARIEDDVELSDGDRIAMGNTVLEYREGT